MTDYDFADQVALITGGSRGLGQAFAEALAHAGATVAIVARSERHLRLRHASGHGSHSAE